jgi:DNA repair exonuclease SbcCD ATPase subunit
MKLERISIKGFLGIEALDLDLKAPVNLFVGQNEAGKSSLRDAVQWAITGQARGLKTHQEQAALIKNGAKAAEVALTLADGQTIARRKTPKSPPVATGDAGDMIRVSPLVFCDAFTFLALPENDRREMLFGLIPGLQPGAGAVAERLAGRLGEVLAAPPDNRQAVNRLASLAAAQGFAAAEKEAVALRREAKRLREGLSLAPLPAQEAPIGGRTYILPDVQAEDVERGLTALQKERDGLVQARGRREAEAGGIDRLGRELARLQENAPEPPEDGEIQEWEDGLNINCDILDKLEGEWRELQPQPAPVEEVFPPTCPAVKSYKLDCPLNGKTAQSVAGYSQDQAPAPAPPDPARLQKLAADLQEQREQVARLEQGRDIARAKARAHDQAMAKIKRLEAEIAELQGQVLAKLPEDLEEQIAGLGRRLANGRELLAWVREFWAARDAYDAAQDKLGQAEQEITLYDALAKALAPDGLPSRLIAEALGPVNELLARAAAILFPGRSLTLTEALGIDLAGSPFATLSKSARFRVGVAFQYALARLAGARLLMIDEADILDPGNRANLVEFLLAARPEFDRILAFATTDSARPSSIPEVQVWRLEGGQAAPMMPQKAA